VLAQHALQHKGTVEFCIEQADAILYLELRHASPQAPAAPSFTRLK
jgi:hypothetical protein